MPLAELQRALASLYTDEGARERLRADPTGFARSFSLDASELEHLSAIGDARLHAYADSLDRKRANEGARILPLSASVLGPRFRAEFLRHARRVPLASGERRYRRDAAAFARSLAAARGDGAIPGPEASLLRFEAAFGSGIAVYPYVVPELARSAARGESLLGSEPRRTLVVRAFGRMWSVRLP